MAPGYFFMVAVRRLRAAYPELRDATNLVPPAGRYVLWNDMDTVDGTVYHTYWYENTLDIDGLGESCRVIRFADIPGTLSGDVLGLKRKLPPLEAEGDYIIDVSAALISLPVIAVDVLEHFKKCKYATETHNLLACQGGSCPGVPKSAHVVQLLGRSPDGELVFEQFARHLLAAVHPLAKCKAWILQLIDGLGPCTRSTWWKTSKPKL
ncbi:hypothetical protein B0T26DRAFT_753681 [Lasiosphaeria miniovina]|uniref:Uncharacterized protein n=1 Tax=Lasiosphaeria miniovina TaxID=1954250 RepID=A0AA40AD05_9PEZI|nr:uncharacterized protein B0T26DRAFT_753681 [Lasiosphaeria miniovina]KAK0713591.1 hypothetical protein B0T26DRAFT_753681 [Lasiosphaeria miniovina]